MGARSFNRFLNSPFFASALQTVRTLSRNRYVRWAVNLVVLAFCAAYLITHFPTILADLRGVRVDAGWLALAVLLTWFVNALGGFAWLLLLRAAAPGVDTLDGLRSHLNSAVARYVPGYVWQFVGKAYLARGLGVPLGAVNRLIAWELVELIGLGSAVALIFSPAARIDEWNLPAWAPWLLSFGGWLLLGGILAAPWLWRGLFSAGLPEGVRIRPGLITLSGLVITASWLMHGLGLWLISAAFGVFHPGALPFLVFAFSISLVTGILVIVVPNGLGVREGIMVILLGQLMPQPLALLVAAVSRLALVTGEFALVGIAGLAHWLRGKRAGNARRADE